MINTRSSQVVAQLRQEIFDGTFPPASPLREVPLADRYGVSRRTLREALLVLNEQGLVVHRHNTGAVVRSFDADDIEDLYKVRRMLECEGAKNAASADDELLRGVERAFLSLEKAAEQGIGSVDLAQADMAFHGAVIALSASPRTDEFYERVGSQMTYAITLLQHREEAFAVPSTSLVAEHRAILDAVVNRDVYASQRLILEHIATHEATLTALVSSTSRQSRRGRTTSEAGSLAGDSTGPAFLTTT
ncbi:MULTISPECIES: GntR family transcriptional regulator [unclassified Arthrobacter]|uniref:GntR family transcriptional regulator n=1 Tax=unclassified Arthrobacter TaxID=235627 RepID=UPI0011AFF10F|nr:MULTISPECIES: GntR family transcriptional regulator [unclassified Arthrobacter]